MYAPQLSNFCQHSMSAQVKEEARKVATRLDRAEKQTLKKHATNHERLKLATMYSLGHKVCFALVKSQMHCQARV